MVSASTYFLVFFGAMAICALAMYMSPSHKRPCPRCYTGIATSARRCRHCAYELP
jgi:hypothetical protein